MSSAGMGRRRRLICSWLWQAAGLLCLARDRERSGCRLVIGWLLAFSLIGVSRRVSIFSRHYFIMMLPVVCLLIAIARTTRGAGHGRGHSVRRLGAGLCRFQSLPIVLSGLNKRPKPPATRCTAEILSRRQGLSPSIFRTIPSQRIRSLYGFGTGDLLPRPPPFGQRIHLHV